MPLHLLGKKSWNVYNSVNIDRVQRDEAKAKAKEEAEEQRMQEEDAQRRIALLRGEVPPLTPVESEHPGSVDDQHRYRDRKRRRIQGEDDTDRDIRYARQTSEAGHKASHALLRDGDRDAALHDHMGNIQLFPAPDENVRHRAEKNHEVEEEKSQKRKREEARYNMRFDAAAGFSRNMESPWYATRDSSSTAGNHTSIALADVQNKDAWGNEDPLRKEREHQRLSTNDPLAAMRQAQRQLKQSERDREMWRKRQIADQRGGSTPIRSRQSRNEKHRRHDDDVSRDEFVLDASEHAKSPRHGYHRKEQHKESHGHHREHSIHKHRGRRRQDANE